MKKCLIYTDSYVSKYQSDLMSLLKEYEMEPHFFNDKEKMELWTRDNDSSQVVLVLLEEQQSYLENVILLLLQQAFIIWIQEGTHKNLKEGKRIKVCESWEEGYLFITKNLKKKIGPVEFKERVLGPKLRSHEIINEFIEVPEEVLTSKIDIQPNLEEKLVENFDSSKIENVTKSKKKDFKKEKEENCLINDQEKELVTSKETAMQQETGTNPEVVAPYYERSRNIQRQLFTRYTREDHKMIGIWSPIHRTGVTSISMNFAFYLAQNRIYTAVLEGLTEQHTLKNRLKRYTKIPECWVSFAKAIHKDGITDESDWTYKGVKFLPLDHDDMRHPWNEFSLESYMTTTKIVDITLVDFPTGEMSSYTEDALSYLDEVWIVVNDDYQDTMSWNTYIQNLKEKTRKPFYLIFNKAFSVSPVKRYAKDLATPLIASIPAMGEEFAQNNYEPNPIFENEEVAAQLLPAFQELTKHLYGEKGLLAQNEVYVPIKKNWWKSIWKMLNT